MKTRFKDLPDSQKQYADLLRDRDLKKTQLEEAEIKSQASLQAGQQGSSAARGETILMIDAPSLPAAPMFPNRPLLIGGRRRSSGWMIGVLLGSVRRAPILRI